jgi:hypothetical protein
VYLHRRMVLLLLYIILAVLDGGLVLGASRKGSVTVTPRDVNRRWMATTLVPYL